MCAERFIIKLSIDTPLASRKWLKIRYNLEAFRSQTGGRCHVDVFFVTFGGRNCSLYSSRAYGYAQRLHLAFSHLSPLPPPNW